MVLATHKHCIFHLISGHLSEAATSMWTQGCTLTGGSTVEIDFMEEFDACHYQKNMVAVIMRRSY